MKWLAQWAWLEIGVWLSVLSFSMFCWWLIGYAVMAIGWAVFA